MRLLIVTQTVDKNDPVLGFFHGWLCEFSKHFERINIICLKEGSHRLPMNVTVHSLGKEKTGFRFQVSGVRRIRYTLRFLSLAWSLRREYDAVFVHMNQEYVLIAGLFWRLMGKRIYLWRNHYAGGLLTDVAALFCAKIFCTSKFSYTAKYRKTILMPVGIDTNVFKPLDLPRKAGSILSLGRIAPSKRVDVLIEALDILKQKKVNVEANVFGDALPKDAEYCAGLLRRIGELGLENVKFYAGVPNDETPKIYSAYDIFVNCSGSGMYDKTIFEAAAAGCIVLAASADYAALAGEELSFKSADELAAKLERIGKLRGEEKEKLRARLRSIAENHSLRALANALIAEMR